MTAHPFADRWRFFQSIIFKNVLLFLLILIVAVGWLAFRYYQDSRNYEIDNVASKLEFFAERGASWIDVASIATLTQPEHKQTPAYQQLLQTLRRIEGEFGVDNAVVMRRQPNGKYVFIAAGHDGMEVQFKGLDQPMMLYDVTGLQGRYTRALPARAPETFTLLAAPLPITCYMVEGKTISEQAMPGLLTQVSTASARVTLADQAPLHTNLKCVITVPETAELFEVYAKVVEHATPTEDTLSPCLHLRFTSLPEDTKTFLEQQRIAPVP